MKLIATDLDGTLLNENGEISEKNAQMLKQALEQGVQVIVATGRSYTAANKTLQAVGLKLPIICLNGASLYTAEGEKLRSIPLSKSLSSKIVDQCESNQVYFELYTNKGVYSPNRSQFIDVMVNIMLSANPTISREEIEERAALRFQEEAFNTTNDFQGLIIKDDIEVYKALAFSLEADVLDKIKEKFNEEDKLVITSSGYDNLEFNHPEGQKGIALSLYAAENNIELDDVMAIGDNFNDLSMLKIAGHSVAMGNAEQTIKNTCSTVTDKNTKDGVAKAIKKILN
ncbi:Putative phosphatase YwpJ [Paraliobacillus sp. PM-2]|uniref:Cof-type HAD-IIB family hydrolase n=1 Tax=Paraliobacillus sp. PM-2 TaxID=1462524 RepID=UPI00061CBC73|nr:Cof-type HAD-IIB family hydrolase [Paraliobacillus sp. PM-2]CQR47911.1 Putative phosphatase YwpJ [Paraliobacillus sp. PM-2]